ncbi:MAG: TIGR03960 family B12-binding radical SAM protein, partial [Deltaproteobacteria bacterium]|nr:TIGR03960 family B12-binding radical SAM protein [Deltaproteobacteria bacterium]
ARVEKPARYAGGEVGSVVKDWDAVDARVCLAFPDVYDIGMSHLGYKILYKILNDDPRTLAERAYCPWVDMEAELRERKLPLVSLDGYHALREFDVVGFSLQFELTFTNILTMLDLGGIPLRAAARGEADPLVVAGGPVATHPEPLTPFLDAIVIGDGEAKLTELALMWTRLRREGVPRAERLRALAGLGGIYVPALYEVEVEPDTGLRVVVEPHDRALPFPVRRTTVDINAYPFPDDGPTGGPEAIFDRTSIEITRGCTEGCRFCQAGMIYRPVQERDPVQVMETVRNAVKKSGNDEVSLTALSTADVSYIHPLIKQLGPELAAEKVSLSVASLRAYGLAPELLDELRRVRAGGLTFAPEAGTQRMRDVVNKNVTEGQLMETAERVFSRGWDRMKLYFMIGLPTEQEEDVRGIIETGAKTSRIGRSITKRAEVTVSVSTHVPKPHTPFQWAAMDTLEEIDRKQTLLRETVRPHRAVKLRTHDARGSVLEGILARGDRRLGDVIERAYLHGARFDSWDEQFDLAIWEEALAHHGVEPEPYLGTLPMHARLPWSHIDVGLEDGFLAREYRKALQDRLSPPCGKVAGAFIHHTNLADAEGDARKLVCYDCGVACDMTAMRGERLVHLRKLGATTRDEAPVERKKRERQKPVVGDPDAGHRIRLRFEKVGAAALLGHLDLVRELPRICKRAGEKVLYGGGFNPKPQMVFTPALSLGLASLGELVDLRLDASHAAGGLEDLLARMNAASPRGLRFVAAEPLAASTPSIARSVAGARYLLVFARSLFDGDADAALAEQCRAAMAAATLPVVRDAKGIKRTLDVRPYLEALTPGGDEGLKLARRAGLTGDVVTLLADVIITQTGACKVSEIATAIFGEGFPHQGVRVEVKLGALVHSIHGEPAEEGERTDSEPEEGEVEPRAIASVSDVAE